MKKNITVALMLVGISLIGFLAILHKEVNTVPEDTEHFIDLYFTNTNGTLATYIKDTQEEDEDIVKGREALSESLGFWMEYALEKEDAALFKQAYSTLNHYFLDEQETGFVYWKITENGEKHVQTNALIDDMRIVHALFQAADKWEERSYQQTAERISKQVISSNRNEELLTDFYDQRTNASSQIITLSYIEPNVLNLLDEKEFVSSSLRTNMFDVLENMPRENAFFPKSYDVKKKKYSFDQSVNLIDQTLVAISLERMNESTQAYYNFITNELNREKAVYGSYDLESKSPVVSHESPALYGLLITYAIERGEHDLAKQFHEKMTSLQHQNTRYNGGYTVQQNNSHIFDNLVPLLAKQKMKKNHLFE